MKKCSMMVAGLALVASTASAQTFGGYSMQLNGSGGNGTPLITGGGVLQLTNDAYSTASTAFTVGSFDIAPTTAWSTSFTLHYVFTSAVTPGFTTGGDGVAFIMQNGAATALGGGGGGIGFEGLPNSFGVGLRSFWNDALIGRDGDIGDQVANPNPAGLEINPGDDFFISVALAYDGANNLSISYLTTRGYLFSDVFTIDESSLGSTVRIGFGSGSGAATQLAEVSDWTFTGLTPSTVTPEPATFGLMGLGLFGVGFVARRRRSPRVSSRP